jgi:hypothetical protein
MPEERLHDELSLLHQMPSLSDIESSRATFVRWTPKFGQLIKRESRS